uniref:Uncharacterized protein n=1 Tax=Oryza sativa subsp. japonica TaxID=39947 RepID=Q69ND6_ORYSJ|nr:hypothetical protein [Oryza sativa Japonica Group]
MGARAPGRSLVRIRQWGLAFVSLAIELNVPLFSATCRFVHIRLPLSGTKRTTKSTATRRHKGTVELGVPLTGGGAWFLLSLSPVAELIGVPLSGAPHRSAHILLPLSIVKSTTWPTVVWRHSGSGETGGGGLGGKTCCHDDGDRVFLEPDLTC